jgi:hypothetical protein
MCFPENGQSALSFGRDAGQLVDLIIDFDTA